MHMAQRRVSQTVEKQPDLHSFSSSDTVVLEAERVYRVVCHLYRSGASCHVCRCYNLPHRKEYDPGLNQSDVKQLQPMDNCKAQTMLLAYLHTFKYQLCYAEDPSLMRDNNR